VLPIELELPTWQTLQWTDIRDTAGLIAMRAQQLSRRDRDLQEAVARMARLREQGKDYWDNAHEARVDALQPGTMVLLKNTKLYKGFGRKLAARWKGPFRIRAVHEHKRWYELEELDGTMIEGTVQGDRLKIFIQR
ncbi:hypothetical protein K402DRAFT_295393, partial [Aulographum hederae CBS 113979]